ncbi:MAG: DIP1984 family protein [Deltaproteobacteria bacterium]|nr:DIP1984 family protein [Deltaproteobacteria bacterium]
MKLAEALMQRADHQKKIAQIKERLLGNALVQDGETPAEDPTELMSTLEALTTQLQELIIRINRTNSATIITDNETFADLLTQRDMLKASHKIYSDLANAASEVRDRYSRSEIKYVSTVKVPDIRKKVDSLAKRFREVDTIIQEYNWKTELSA